LVTQGVPVPTNKVIVDQVVNDSPAAAAGLKEKDVILKLNSLSLTSPTSLISLTKKYSGQIVTLTIQRDSQVFPVNIIPRKNPPKGEGPLGVAITSYLEKKYPWYQAPFFGLYEAVRITYQIASELSKVLFQLITFQHPQVDVTGPVGIVSYTSTAIKFGKNAVLELLALLSFNLAIINIFPFPALDGGRLLFVVYEGITKKRPNKNIEKYTNFVGMIILLTLGVLITISDVIKLFK
jgi:regulator of sigma E protease